MDVELPVIGFIREEWIKLEEDDKDGRSSAGSEGGVGGGLCAEPSGRC